MAEQPDDPTEVAPEEVPTPPGPLTIDHFTLEARASRNGSGPVNWITAVNSRGVSIDLVCGLDWDAIQWVAECLAAAHDVDLTVIR